MKRVRSGDFAQRWRAARACARCHRLKSRCVYEDPEHASCRRCYALEIACSVEADPTAQTARRRPAMKLPARTPDQILRKVQRLLADAEREFSRMPGADHEGENGEEHLHKNTTVFQQPRPAQDVLSSLISEAEACARYACFHERMAIYFPVLTFPGHLRDFRQAMAASPLLVLACIYVTTICDHGLSEAHQNRRLGSQVLEYLDKALAQTIYVEAADLSYHIVFACMILSLWGVPPLRVHQYKSHIDLITAYSVAVCIDAGNVSLVNPLAVLSDDSVERNNLRSFLAVYCSCGSLNFSLPRFNFATWSPRHNLAMELLSRPLSGTLPSQGDRFLCFYSRVIRVGKQLSDFLTESGVSMNLLTSEEERGGLAGLCPPGPRANSLRFQKLVADLSVYEKNLTDTVSESGILGGLTQSAVAPGERFCLLLTYYHLVMMIHDNLVSCCIYNLTVDNQVQPQGMYFPQQDKDLIMEHIRKFGEICGRILGCFIELNASGVTGYPTFFYYRALTALISLIRLLILVKSDILQVYFPEIQSVRFRLPCLYAEVLKIVDSSKEHFDLQVCERFSDLLQRIGRWVPVVAANDNELSTDSNDGIDFLELTDISKGQEVEKFAARQMLRNDDGKLTPMAISALIVDAEDEHASRGQDLMSDNAPKPASFSIKEMFKGIDEDIIRYLNPFDTLDAGFSFTFD
ncbi:hypothetical protein METBIDRAFT_42157 [Metschnikowia bicuspidata var. bicuspidata NRRL YB-4993]|uniref:Zn(2)-C6 fungal-type domain-containing protein n=1 Tax=Metschnikowia bicuspidata var. bicuspidata NRRL YB-4993 TaxID=869754 RepID=A0A1A0HBN9_9ASCO|nr:hypothetical protein METBIDRAFT_42157 [Metschnikowia bicuspidata var. bicuspidata NRRL YB-4993]OBA21303.1 hypothetical protein METBIDRAFT_42157 [Metschnikowia bicuspidata var. bicuspidata NRRL YB-4993]